MMGWSSRRGLMWAIVITFLVVIAVFTLGVRWGSVVIGKVLGRVVHDRHRNAEDIIGTGAVPEQRLAPYFKRIDRLEANRELSDEDRRRRISRLEAKARRNSIKRINGLLRYFKRAPVFTDESSRRLLLDRLAAARAAWLEHARPSGG